MRKKILVMVVIITGIIACKKTVEEEAISFVSPSHFPQPVYRFADNEINAARFKLGRKLFYETMLSANNTISCGSCHIQTSAFTHHGHMVSHGIYDRLGTRNSPPIMNLAWSPSLMWDGGIADLDLQPIAPITNHVEMDDSLPDVLNKLRNSIEYPGLFEKAYGTKEITGTRMLKALSQFMLMCVSSNSKYDSVQQGKTSFTADELNGYRLFQAKCNSCHKEPLFTDYSFRDNGIGTGIYDDAGRYLITSNPLDKYKFKVPSLRNLSYTAPYMHDGRFSSIDDVLDHYSNKVKPTPNLDPLLQQGTVLGIPLSAQDKTNLKTFLKTLDDHSFLTNSLLAEQ